MMNAINVLNLALKVFHDRNVTGTSVVSSQDEQMCDRIVQLMDNHNFVADHYVKHSCALDSIPNEYEDSDGCNVPDCEPRYY